MHIIKEIKHSSRDVPSTQAGPSKGKVVCFCFVPVVVQSCSCQFNGALRLLNPALTPACLVMTE